MPVLPRWCHKGRDPRNQLLWGQQQFMMGFAAGTVTLPLTRGRLGAAVDHLLAFDSNPLAGFHAKAAAVIIGLHGFGARSV
jgi:hypothetical protein